MHPKQPAARSEPGEKERADDGRVAGLQALVAAFTRTLSRVQAAELVLDLGMPVVRAIAGEVHLVSPDFLDAREGGLERVASRGMTTVLAGAEEALARVSVGLHAAEPEWVESTCALCSTTEERAACVHRAPGRAWACISLVVDSRGLGVLLLGFDEGRRFSDSDRAYMVGFAQVCAQALERARLFDEERAARERNLRLQRVTAAFSRALTVEEVAGVGVSLGVEALGAKAGWLMLLSRDGASLEMINASGVPEAARAQHARVPSSSDSLASEAVRDREPIFIETEAAWDPHRRGVQSTVGFEIAARAAVPLSVGGRAIGAVVLGFGTWRRFRETDRGYMIALAHQCAQALERARLYGEARAAEEESRRTASRMRLLAELSQSFAEATTDYPRLLATIARNVAEKITDGCIVRLLSDDGVWLVPVAIVDADPARQQRLRGVVDHEAVRVAEHPVLRGVVETGAPAVHVAADLEHALGATPQLEGLLTDAPATSLIVVALRARGRPVGTLAVTRAGRPFEQADVDLVQDVADRAALAIENARLYVQATDAVRVRDDFLSVAGHELKTPLTALLLQVHSLARAARADGLAPKLLERADKAVQSGLRLSRLIDELLDISRVSAGRLTLEVEEVDLGEATRDAISRLEGELSRAECEVRIAEPARVVGTWDRARTDQIVNNLLTNAMKYGRGKPIDIRISALDDMATLAVTDHGIGIAPEDHARIFDRFERAVSTRHFGGLGLGLWIVRQIVEANGGSIAVESAPGEGATFFVRLPLAPHSLSPRPAMPYSTSFT